MFLGTHACIPLISIGTIDIIQLGRNKSFLLKNNQTAWIGLAGILPDILWPHTSLHARLTSWTHTIWFLLAALPAIFILSRLVVKKNFGVFVLLFWLAIVLHVVADMLSGGVSLLYPIEMVIGNHFVPWKYWVYCDLVFILITSLVFVIRYGLKKKSLKT